MKGTKVLLNKSGSKIPLFVAFWAGVIVGIPFGYKLNSVGLETEIILTQEENYETILETPELYDSDVRQYMENSNEELENYLKKILVEDWTMSFSDIPSEEKLNVPISEPFIKGLKCESNSELDIYIKKPKFSRDRHDYDVSRNNYEPQNLVCPEGPLFVQSFSKIPAVQDCSDRVAVTCSFRVSVITIRSQRRSVVNSVTY